MTTLYIDRKNTQLKIETGALVVFINQQRQGTIPLGMLERIVISSNTQVETNLLLKLTENDVHLSIINPRKSTQQARLCGGFSKNSPLRLKQYQLAQDPEKCIGIARDIIKAKILQHLRFYQKVNKQRPDLHRHTHKVQQHLKQAWQNCTAETLNLDSLRGIEGSAAKASFACYQQLFPDTLQFTGRNRRPPKDPVNACLSLAFTLLHYRATQQAYARGLDPMIGFLHEPKYSRDSLASDIIEVWRPHIEAWVWEIFRERYIRESDFTINASSCLLNKSGRQKFYAAFEQRMKPLARAIRWQLSGFIRTYLSQ